MPNRSILFVFACPRTRQHLRLDDEENAIDRALLDSGLPQEYKRTLRAATPESLHKELVRNDFEIIHFSGHGGKNGLYLDGGPSTSHQVLDFEGLASLLKLANPPLKALVCVSCFSHEFLLRLADVVPYVVAISGEVDDEASIRFVSAFYQSYFTRGQLEARDYVTKIYTRSEGSKRRRVIEIRPRLIEGMRRQQESTLVTVLSRAGHDPLKIDISQAQESITALGMSTDHFVSQIKRKMTFHDRIFDIPRENAIIQIGAVFGKFSWESRDRTIECHDVFRFSPNSDSDLTQWWVSLVVTYNDWLVEPFRLVKNPRSVDISFYKQSLQRMQKYIFGEKSAPSYGHGARLRSYGPQLDVVFGGRSTIVGMMEQAERYLSLANEHYIRKDRDRIASNIEAFISSIHTIIEYLAKGLSKSN